jgi:hypothetical protein
MIPSGAAKVPFGDTAELTLERVPKEPAFSHRATGRATGQAKCLTSRGDAVVVASTTAERNLWDVFRTPRSRTRLDGRMADGALKVPHMEAVLAPVVEPKRQHAYVLDAPGVVRGVLQDVPHQGLLERVTHPNALLFDGP